MAQTPVLKSHSTSVSGLLIKSSHPISFRLKCYLENACFLDLNYTDSCPYLWKAILALLFPYPLLISLVRAYLSSVSQAGGQVRGDLSPLVTKRRKLSIFTGCVLVIVVTVGCKFTLVLYPHPHQMHSDNRMQNCPALGGSVCILWAANFLSSEWLFHL